MQIVSSGPNTPDRAPIDRDYDTHSIPSRPMSAISRSSGPSLVRRQALRGASANALLDIVEPANRPTSAKPYYMRREFFKYSHERIEGQEAIVSPAVHTALKYSTCMEPGPAMTRVVHSAPATPTLFSDTGRRRASRPTTPWSSRPSTPSPALISTFREAAFPTSPQGHFQRRFLGDDCTGGQRSGGSNMVSRTPSVSSATTPSSLHHAASRMLSPQKQALVALTSMKKARRKSSVIVGQLCQTNEARAPSTAPSIALSSTSPHLYNIWVATKQRLVSAGDPDGDFTWSVPEPETYVLLPRKTMDMKDWHAFSMIMCDLRFLFKMIEKTGVQSILQLFHRAWVPLEKDGAVTSQLEDYRNFLTAHLVRLEVSAIPALYACMCYVL